MTNSRIVWTSEDGWTDGPRAETYVTEDGKLAIDEEMAFHKAAMIEQYGQEAWDAYVAYGEAEAERVERECGVSISMGPEHDPYGTSCELDRGHDGPHNGPHPFAEGYGLRWTGGGSCAGDPLPFQLDRSKEENR